MLSYNISSYSNIRNYLKTICLFIFITLPIPSIIMLLYPELFSFLEIGDIYLLGKLGVAITFLSVGLISFYQDKNFIITSKKDYSKIFLYINIIQLFIATFMAIIAYNLLDYVIKENKNSIIVIFPTIFIPLLVSLFFHDYSEKLLLKRYPDIYYPYDYYKKFPDAIKEREKIKNEVDCMCISCMPDGVKREYIADKYLKKYTLYERILLQIRYIFKNIGSSLIGPLSSLLVPLFLSIFIVDTKIILFLSIFILSLFIIIARVLAKKSLVKKLSKKERIEDEYSYEVIKVAKEYDVKINGVYKIEEIFGESEKNKYLKRGFDYQTQACYLPLKKKEGLIFLGHAYRKGDQSLKGVVGHEIGHGLRKSTNYDTFCDMLTAFLSTIIYIYLILKSYLFISIIGLISLGVIIRVIRMYFRRDLEFSADKFAAKIYNSDDFILFFKKLERYFHKRRDYDLSLSFFTFLTSHPSEKDRIKALESLDK